MKETMRIMTRSLATGILGILCGCAGGSDSRPYTAESVIQAQQSRPRTNTTALSTPAAGIPVAATQPTPAVEQSYPEDGEHWIHVVLDRGAQLKLEDGSLWEIAPKNQNTAQFWFVADKIVVTPNGDRRYPFTLSNRAKNNAVDARLLAAEPAR